MWLLYPTNIRQIYKHIFYADNLSSPGASQRPIKKILQQQQLDSDDDESENDMDNGSEDDDDSDASGPTPAVRKSSTNLMLSGQRVTPRSSSNDIAVTATATPAARKSNFMLSGNRASQHIPAPSDEDEDEDAADSDDDKSDSSAPTHSARKSSTNLMLSGSRASQHLPPPSDDDEDDDDHSQGKKQNKSCWIFGYLLGCQKMMMMIAVRSKLSSKRSRLFRSVHLQWY